MDRIEFLEQSLWTVANWSASNMLIFHTRRSISTSLSGVYILFSEKSGIEYIGQSQRIRWRLNPKQHPCYNPDRHAIAVIEIEDDTLRYSLENLLIYTFEPKGNQAVKVHIWEGGRIERAIEQVRTGRYSQLGLNL